MSWLVVTVVAASIEPSLAEGGISFGELHGLQSNTLRFISLAEEPPPPYTPGVYDPCVRVEYGHSSMKTIDVHCARSLEPSAPVL